VYKCIIELLNGFDIFSKLCSMLQTQWFIGVCVRVYVWVVVSVSLTAVHFSLHQNSLNFFFCCCFFGLKLCTLKNAGTILCKIWTNPNLGLKMSIKMSSDVNKIMGLSIHLIQIAFLECGILHNALEYYVKTI